MFTNRTCRVCLCMKSCLFLIEKHCEMAGLVGSCIDKNSCFFFSHCLVVSFMAFVCQCFCRLIEFVCVSQTER